MKTLKIIVSYLTVFAAFSCNDKALTKTAQIDTIATTDNIIADQTVFQDSSFVSNKSSDDADTITYIKFPDLTLSINRLVVWDEEKKLNQLQTDSVSLSAELGETIEGQKISISTKELTDIIIEQRYETSVAISNEGPHCDLTDWKHYYSDWKPLKQLSDGKFVGITYDLKENERSPKVPINELKERVREQCGEEWYQLVKNIKSPYEYPSSVGISRYYLKVTGKQKTTGKTIKKTIIIELPMGC
ncbi:hypothetical protein [Microcoleus sp. F10-A1]|uniref:hypothetical protein n=1 Tax=Microcoleus sp. F10-A1 TaxID=2818750 RepID=UPI002FD23D2D